VRLSEGFCETFCGSLELIPLGVRGNKKSESEIRIAINEIRKMIALEMSDEEILARLKIPKSTFYRYKSRIYNEDRELWERVSIEPLESRAILLKESLEHTYRIAREIASNNKNPPRVTLYACKKMVEAQFNIIQLLIKGPNLWKLPT
jgi:hypothetical protein